jgi:hypothetical protein
MYHRVAILIAVASAMAASGLAAPDAHADPRDQQFLQIVHENHIAGDDSTLLDYARQFCDSTTGLELPARPDLYRQGVRPDQFYAVNLAASHVYCSQRLATPPTNSFKGAGTSCNYAAMDARETFDSVSRVESAHQGYRCNGKARRLQSNGFRTFTTGNQLRANV